MEKDLFETRNIKPMLLTRSEPFDSEEHIFELKLDGTRCLAYLDKNGVELRNKRNVFLNDVYPELMDMNKQIKKRCILDGELVVLRNGKPYFQGLQKRSLMSNPTKISMAMQKYPASYVAFDILYLEDKNIIDLNLLDRKEKLSQNVKESEKFAISRFISTNGIGFYNLAVSQGLEGVVAKYVESKYLINKRTKNWIKFKNTHDIDLIICGFIPSNKRDFESIVLGGYRNGKLKHMGNVSMGVSRYEHRKLLEIYEKNKTEKCPFEKCDDKQTEWVKPKYVVTVEYLEITGKGYLRHPIYKGLREDKEPKDCDIESQTNYFHE